MPVRTIVTALCALALVSLMVGDPAGGAVGGDWPHVRPWSLPRRVPAVRERGIAPDSAASLDVLWRRDLTPRGGRSSEVYAAPVVADGLVFAGPMRAYVPHGLLWALDVRTGAPRWKTTDLRDPVAPPAVSQGVVVVNAGAADRRLRPSANHRPPMPRPGRRCGAITRSSAERRERTSRAWRP